MTSNLDFNLDDMQLSQKLFSVDSAPSDGTQYSHVKPDVSMAVAGDEETSAFLSSMPFNQTVDSSLLSLGPNVGVNRLFNYIVFYLMYVSQPTFKHSGSYSSLSISSYTNLLRIVHKYAHANKIALSLDARHQNNETFHRLSDAVDYVRLLYRGNRFMDYGSFKHHGVSTDNKGHKVALVDGTDYVMDLDFYPYYCQITNGDSVYNPDTELRAYLDQFDVSERDSKLTTLCVSVAYFIKLGLVSSDVIDNKLPKAIRVNHQRYAAAYDEFIASRGSGNNYHLLYLQAVSIFAKHRMVPVLEVHMPGSNGTKVGVMPYSTVIASIISNVSNPQALLELSRHYRDKTILNSYVKEISPLTPQRYSVNHGGYVSQRLSVYHKADAVIKFIENIKRQFKGTKNALVYIGVSNKSPNFQAERMRLYAEMCGFAFIWGDKITTDRDVINVVDVTDTTSVTKFATLNSLGAFDNIVVHMDVADNSVSKSNATNTVNAITNWYMIPNVVAVTCKACALLDYSLTVPGTFLIENNGGVYGARPHNAEVVLATWRGKTIGTTTVKSLDTVDSVPAKAWFKNFKDSNANRGIVDKFEIDATSAKPFACIVQKVKQLPIGKREYSYSVPLGEIPTNCNVIVDHANYKVVQNDSKSVILFTDGIYSTDQIRVDMGKNNLSLIGNGLWEGNVDATKFVPLRIAPSGFREYDFDEQVPNVAKDKAQKKKDDGTGPKLTIRDKKQSVN